ncbi:hypothetical protein TNIN_288701 [Trichonephila inaurata madagascariensis]|uniref:Uncharacterized protein n=1 Tax=Trichonephila inaurata madagascariensis TaxID=2747483 RepID=A0A8X6WNW9_9ARAC|nr:hypothetical protein TNIN_288701 [Trichonephila inaurata madagascariensis]
MLEYFGKKKPELLPWYNIVSRILDGTAITLGCTRIAAAAFLRKNLPLAPMEKEVLHFDLAAADLLLRIQEDIEKAAILFSQTNYLIHFTSPAPV